MIKERLVKYIEDSLTNNWEQAAFSDYKGEDFLYKDVAEQIMRLHSIFELCGIQEQDKVAFIGKNSANWAIVFAATISYGAVAVPILPDFLPADVQNIVDHSDAKLLLSSGAILETLSFDDMPQLKAVFTIEDFSLKHSRDKNIPANDQKFGALFAEKYPQGITKQQVQLSTIANNKLALISYTSGTTGNSKGVMISHNSLSANIRFARNNMPLESGDSILSFLPLAHAYGLAFEFLFPFSIGCHITFLTKTPSPQIITQAFSEIKPRLILSVPLVIEKIYKKKLLPSISKPPLSILLKIPGANKLIYKKINKKLSAVFGNNFHEVVIGGAAFNSEAEAFFKKIKFPFTIGYGMTECGPLISYASWKNIKLQSAGVAVDTLEVRIDSEDPENKVGEILMRGDNVMDGYYKNPEATKAAIDADGWLHSGDLGLMDKEGNIFIKGRSKSMLLGPSGQNIYPEEIESVLNNKDYVLESLVVEEEGKLIGLICPDQELIKRDKLTENDLLKIMEENKKELNKQVPPYMNVSKFVMHNEEFVKTPKRSIKRYLYTGKNYSAMN